MRASCPCHVEWPSVIDFYDHLVGAHCVSREAAFVLAQLALLEVELAFLVDADGSVVLARQLRLPGPP